MWTMLTIPSKVIDIDCCKWRQRHFQCYANGFLKLLKVIYPIQNWHAFQESFILVLINLITVDPLISDFDISDCLG